MAISIPDNLKVRLVHDFDQKPGVASVQIDDAGPLAIVDAGNHFSGLPAFEPCDGTNNEGYIGFGLVPANLGAGITAVKNTVITGFAGVVPAKEVFLGQDGSLTQDVTSSDAPAAAPALSEGPAGVLAAGTYHVGYSYVDDDGETILSDTDDVVITANKKITVAAVTPLPAGVDSVNWYMSVAPGSTTLKFILNNDGSTHDINALPAGNAASPLTSVAAVGSRRIGLGATDQLIVLD